MDPRESDARSTRRFRDPSRRCPAVSSQRAGASRRLLLGFISVTWTVSPDIPPTEVFIGTTSGRGSGYKPALQAPVRVRHVAPANHRISSLPQDMAESVAFPVPSGHSGTFAATWTRYRRHDLSPRSRRFWPWHAAFDSRMTSFIDLPTAQNVTSRIEPLSRFDRISLFVSRMKTRCPSSSLRTVNGV